MISFIYKVDNNEGFHLRPAGILAKAAKEFDCETTITYEEKSINAKSVMTIVAACIKGGSEIEIKCDGPQENECVEALKKLAENNFAG